MDTKRVNIYAGSILGGLLLFLLLGFFSNLIYHGPEHAGGEEEILAYAVEVQDTGEGTGEEAAEVNLAALAAEADPDDGASVFNKCKACHSLEEGDHGVGPALNNVLGADIASAEGFDYTDALTGLEGDWDLETLSAFLENPQGYAPGTKMSFAGIGDPEDRVDVIAYLNQAGDSPVELVPEGAETAAAETGTETDAGEQAAEGEDAAGEEGQQQAAAEEDETAQETEQAAEEGGDDQAGGEYAELLANASAEEGEKVYRKCQACHTLEEGTHRVGPSLYGVVGSEAGTAEGYDYSDAMAEFGEEWTLANLDGYLASPNEFIPGNKMTFPGLDDAQDRIDVITYINQAADSPVDLGAGGEPAAEDEKAEGEAAEEEAAQETQTAEGQAAEAETEQAAAEEQETDQAAAEEQETEQAATGDQETEPAAEEGAEEATEETGGGEFAELLANASAEEGEKVFRKCQACHTLDEGKHRVGPSLYGVIGSQAGGAEGYDYSDVMAEFGEDWTLANLDAYLENPNEFLPGNKMTFPGIKDAQDRIDVFTYIDQADGERDLPQ